MTEKVMLPGVTRKKKPNKPKESPRPSAPTPRQQQIAISQSTEIVDLVQETADLRQTPDGEPFLTIFTDEHLEHLSLQQLLAREWVSKQYYETTQTVPYHVAVSEALQTLQGLARFEGECCDLHTRVAEFQGRLYVDLVDPLWRAVEVTRQEWKVVDVPPVAFRRTRGMLSHPEPRQGGDIQALRPFLNVASDDDFLLTVCAMVNMLQARGPYPVLIVEGEQGSAKSTLVRVIRALIDPHAVPLRTLPTDLRDLMISARGSHVLAYDNVSDLRAVQADAICRLSTGGGFTKRANYTDLDEIFINVQRPVILNGIEELATRPDLQDRSIVLQLPRIQAHERVTEANFWTAFEQQRASILGVLLDGLVSMLKNEDRVVADRLPRMADFLVRSVAAEPAFKLPGSVVHAYDANLRRGMAAAVEASPIGSLILALVEDQRWQGTATRLLDALGQMAGKEERGRGNWPGSASSLSGQLKRLTPVLSRMGVEVSARRAGKDGERILTIVRTPVRGSSGAGGSSAVSIVSTVSDPVGTGSAADDTADGRPAADEPADASLPLSSADRAPDDGPADDTDDTDDTDDPGEESGAYRTPNTEYRTPNTEYRTPNTEGRFLPPLMAAPVYLETSRRPFPGHRMAPEYLNAFLCRRGHRRANESGRVNASSNPGWGSGAGTAHGRVEREAKGIQLLCNQNVGATDQIAGFAGVENVVRTANGRTPDRTPSFVPETKAGTTGIKQHDTQAVWACGLSAQLCAGAHKFSRIVMDCAGYLRHILMGLTARQSGL